MSEGTNMTKSQETEIAVLQEQTRVFDSDLSEVKTTLTSMDSKLEEIKSLLGDQYVTKKEFEGYKRSQNLQKWLVGIITAIITTVITVDIMRVLQ